MYITTIYASALRVSRGNSSCSTVYICPHTDMCALTNMYKHILLPHTDMCPQ